jgi:ribonuclease HI
MAIKAQALSDFITEWTEIQSPLRERELEYWTINFDGSLQLQGAGAGILVTFPKGENFKYILQMHFLASSNVAEYETLLHGPRITTSLSIRWLKILGDSLLVINQANKEWCCLDEKMMTYCQEIHKLEDNFDRLEYHHVLHRRNEVPDELAKLGSSRGMVPLGVFMQELHEPSISKALSKASKVVESVDNTTTLANDKLTPLVS